MAMCGGLKQLLSMLLVFVLAFGGMLPSFAQGLAVSATDVSLVSDESLTTPAEDGWDREVVCTQLLDGNDEGEGQPYLSVEVLFASIGSYGTGVYGLTEYAQYPI